MVILNNSNNTPMPTIGSYSSVPNAPTSMKIGNNSGPVGNLGSTINSPNQVIGLVPLFPCCGANQQHAQTVPAIGGFSMLLTPPTSSSTYAFTLIIGGITYSTITIYNPSIASLVSAINTNLVSIGVTASVIVTAGALNSANTFVQCSITVSLHAPIGSGTTYNGITVAFTSSFINIKIYSLRNFSGGIGVATSDPCLCECREGMYGGDSISDDRQYVLPVFADLSCNDSYHNDINSWLLTFPGNLNPISGGFFRLMKLIGGTYTQIAVLNNSTYGTPISNACGQVCNVQLNSGTLIIGNVYTIVSYNAGDNFTNVGASSNTGGITFTATGQVPTTWTNGTLLTSMSPCTNVNYGGFILNWQLVLAAFGEGTYLFYVGGGTTQDSPKYCLGSPPFCLKAWTCIGVSGTIKWEANYSGGNFGSVTTQGQSWSLCCTSSNGGPQAQTTKPLPWVDSIRVYGFFGYETAEYQRDFIKYSTGTINKIRDEAVKKFMVKTDRWPMWMHERFFAYGLMADQLFVSDYNLNNANYNYKHFWVVADSNYTPQYTNYSRYTKILDLMFKEGEQFIFRDRCCN